MSVWWPSTSFVLAIFGIVFIFCAAPSSWQDGEITLGQSMAIAHSCAKLAKLEGEGADWAISEMMMAESNDIYEVFMGAKHRGEAPDSEANWEKAMTEELPKHLAMLEGKITESGFFGSKMCAGDVAIASVINFGLDNDLDLAPFPKLQAMYAAICLGEGPCASYIASAPGPYFKRPTPPPVLFYWGMKARAHVHVMLLTAGKVDFKWEQDPGDYKTFSPFGQLPFLKVSLFLALVLMLKAIVSLEWGGPHDISHHPPGLFLCPSMERRPWASPWRLHATAPGSPTSRARVLTGPRHR